MHVRELNVQPATERLAGARQPGTAHKFRVPMLTWAALRQVLANTVNGTTYAGIRARTTGAPQNHWFGPSGDPRGAGERYRKRHYHVNPKDKLERL